MLVVGFNMPPSAGVTYYIKGDVVVKDCLILGRFCHQVPCDFRSKIGDILGAIGQQINLRKSTIFRFGGVPTELSSTRMIIFREA